MKMLFAIGLGLFCLSSAGGSAQPARPKAIVLPAGPMIRLPSINVETPIPLPILGKPEKDRASVADPTLELSVAAALKPISVSRRTPQPAPPINLPDPFENSRAVQLRVIPDEIPIPASITPK